MKSSLAGHNEPSDPKHAVLPSLTHQYWVERSAKGQRRVNSHPAFYLPEFWPSYAASQKASFWTVKVDIILPGLLSTLTLMITSNAMETPSAQEVSGGIREQSPVKEGTPHKHKLCPPHKTAQRAHSFHAFWKTRSRPAWSQQTSPVQTRPYSSHRTNTTSLKSFLTSSQETFMLRSCLNPILAPITDYHSQGDLINKHLFLAVLEAEKFNIKIPEDSVCGESSLPDS